MLKNLLGILLTALAIAIVLPRSFGGNSRGDLLAYTLMDRYGKTSLLIYDPQFGVSVPVHTDSNQISFSFSADGRLAFSSGPSAIGQIHILDLVSGQSFPTGISPDVQRLTYPLTWSRDGRYLAFASSVDVQRQQLYVWDGRTAINITPDGLVDTAGNY